MMINLSEETLETVRNALATALAHYQINLKRSVRFAKKCAPGTPEHVRALARVDEWVGEIADADDALSIFEDRPDHVLQDIP